MARICLLLLIFASIGCGGLLSEPKQNLDQLNDIALKIKAGENEKAVTDLEAYLETYPEDSLAWTILGNVHSKTGRLDDAQTAYEKAISLDPKQSDAVNGLGVLHRKRGNYDAAMEAYQKAIAINPKNAQAYSSMTTIAFKKHEDAKALEYARKGYDLDQTDPVIAANLAIAYHYNKDIENRDKFTAIAKELGYSRMEDIEKIYSGEMTIYD